MKRRNQINRKHFKKVDNDLTFDLESKTLYKEYTIADLLISGFCRKYIKSSNFFYQGLIAMIFVEIIVNFFDKNPHLPWLITKLIPMKQIFNGEIMDLRSPKWTNLSYSAQTVLKIWLKWRRNTVQSRHSPNCSLTTVILSENEKKFNLEGCLWLKSVMPYHPEIKYVDLSNNYIKPKSLQFIIDGIKIRKDNQFIQYPFLQLRGIYIYIRIYFGKYIPINTDIYIYRIESWKK